MLHQRFPKFSGLLLENLKSSITPPPSPQSFSGVSIEQKEKDESQRLMKQKLNLRYLTELYLAGIIKDNSNCLSKDSFIPMLLNILFSKDKTQHANISIAENFAKHYAQIFNVESKNESIVKNEISEEVTKILTIYYETLCKHLVFEHDRLKKMENSNEDMAIIKGGDLSEDRKEVFERRKKFFEKLKLNASKISSVLKLDMPVLAEDELITQFSIGISDGRITRDENHRPSGVEILGIWQDEESRSFYEKLTDLSNVVPGILLGTKPPNTSEVESSPDQPLQPEPIQEEEATNPTASEEHNGEAEGDKTDGTFSGASWKTTFDSIVARLPSALNKDTIDSLAVEFAYINKKVTRKRLVQAILSVSRQRLDLLPFYSRLIATVGRYMPDISQAILESVLN